MIDERAYLFAAFWQIQRFRAALHQITHAVRFRAPTPMPKRMQRQLFSRLRPRQQFFRHHGKAAPDPGESASFGKTAQLIADSSDPEFQKWNAEFPIARYTPRKPRRRATELHVRAHTQ